MSLNQLSDRLEEVKKLLQAGETVVVGRISQSTGVHRVVVEGDTITVLYNRHTKEISEYTGIVEFRVGDSVTFDYNGRTLLGNVAGFVSAGRSPYLAAKRQGLQGDYRQFQYLQIRGQHSYIVSAMHNGEMRFYWPKVSTLRKV